MKAAAKLLTDYPPKMLPCLPELFGKVGERNILHSFFTSCFTRLAVIPAFIFYDVKDFLKVSKFLLENLPMKCLMSLMDSPERFRQSISLSVL